MNATWNQLKPEEINTHYLELFNKIFPGQTPARTPTHVIVGYFGEKIIGMIDGYPRNRGEFFIHYAGFIPGTSFKDILKGWSKMMEDFKSLGIRNLTTQVKNDNSNSLRLLLKLGYLIYGTHNSYGALYIDLFKEI